MDEVDRRIAALKALEKGKRPPRGQGQESILAARRKRIAPLFSFMACLKANLTGRTTRKIIIDAHDPDRMIFTAGVLVTTPDGVVRRDILRVHVQPRLNPKTPPHSLYCFADLVHGNGASIRRRHFDGVTESNFPKIASLYADAFLDALARGIANGWVVD